MKSIEQLTIKSSNSKYKVLLKKSHSLDFSKRYVIIFDKNLQDYATEYKTSDSLLLPVLISEKDKNLETCGKLLKEMAAKNVNKDFEIIAIGGGAIQDIATLVASIYMRGLNWTYIPTTTMSMMDSCIGGKSSINIDNYKNIIGNFYPPSTILIDEALNDYEVVWAAAGHPHAVYPTSFAELVAATGAKPMVVGD
jgi:3-dehydroquinate synthase